MKRFSKKSDFYVVACSAVNNFLDDRVTCEMVENVDLYDYVGRKLNVIINKYLDVDIEYVYRVFANNMRYIIQTIDDNDIIINRLYNCDAIDIYKSTVLAYIVNYKDDIVSDWIDDNID